MIEHRSLGIRYAENDLESGKLLFGHLGKLNADKIAAYVAVNQKTF